MTNFSKAGLVYGVIWTFWTFGKPPEDLDLGLEGWEIGLFYSVKGRSSSISNLRKLGVGMIYTFELKLSELIEQAQMSFTPNLDRKVKI